MEINIRKLAAYLERLGCGEIPKALRDYADEIEAEKEIKLICTRCKQEYYNSAFDYHCSGRCVNDVLAAMEILVKVIQEDHYAEFGIAADGKFFLRISGGKVFYGDTLPKTILLIKEE